MALSGDSGRPGHGVSGPTGWLVLWIDQARGTTCSWAGWLGSTASTVSGIAPRI